MFVDPAVGFGAGAGFAAVEDGRVDGLELGIVDGVDADEFDGGGDFDIGAVEWAAVEDAVEDDVKGIGGDFGSGFGKGLWGGFGFGFGFGEEDDVAVVDGGGDGDAGDGGAGEEGDEKLVVHDLRRLSGGGCTGDDGGEDGEVSEVEWGGGVPEVVVPDGEAFGDVAGEVGDFEGWVVKGGWFGDGADAPGEGEFAVSPFAAGGELGAEVGGIAEDAEGVLDEEEFGVGWVVVGKGGA